MRQSIPRAARLIARSPQWMVADPTGPPGAHPGVRHFGRCRPVSLHSTQVYSSVGSVEQVELPAVGTSHPEAELVAPLELLESP